MPTGILGLKIENNEVVITVDEHPSLFLNLPEAVMLRDGLNHLLTNVAVLEKG